MALSQLPRIDLQSIQRYEILETKSPDV